MMSGVELKEIRYRDNADQPPAYPNLGYRGSPDDKPETDASNVHENNVDQPNVTDETRKDADNFDKQVNIGTEDESDDEDYDGEPNALVRGIQVVQDAIYGFLRHNKKIIIGVIVALILMLYIAYFCYAMYCHFGDETTAPDFATCLHTNRTLSERIGDESPIRLLWVTCVVVAFIIYWLLKKAIGDIVSQSLKPSTRRLNKYENIIFWILAGMLFLAVIIFIIVDVTVLSKKPYNLVSLSGIFFYVLVFFVFSINPARVKWRPVVWGIGLQLVFALLILRWSVGFAVFSWMGDRVAEFLQYSNAGAAFVFGEEYEHHFFVFVVLPIIVFFSTMINILYYLGVMQVIIQKVAWIMQFAMCTTAGESLSAAANIFVGLIEAPLMVRPLVKHMTKSELHAVMTGGFASIAGSVLGVYIYFGVPANHLLSASVMSAPAALALSKLAYPEMKKSKTTTKDVATMEKSKEKNLIEAASAGASQSVKLVANITANLIAFLAILAFLNATLTWLGDRVGVEKVTFEWICSYVLWPLAVLMGVEIGDCRRVASLIGTKVFLNEYIAYYRLTTVYMANHETFIAYNSTNWEYHGDDLHLLDNNVTLQDGILSPRSTVIATYALCGFSHIGSMGIMLGGLGGMAPERRSEMASFVVRAMLAGNAACFMTACIAGLFYQGEL